MEDSVLHERLRKVLALTNSPVEGEAQAAAAMLAKLLTAHNLSIADLERRGKAAPSVREDKHDLGKAAFTWKLNLAEEIADFYFCAPLVDRRAKTVAFVGRPDNVEALQMLYGWVIDQIKRLAAEERRNHFIRTNEHIDPLRWQVNFGLGAVQRLRTRLQEIRRAQVDETTTALVIHHKSEISDYLEQVHGYRIDDRMTKAQAESEQRWQQWTAERKQAEEAKAALKEADIEEFYRKYPEERPEAVEARRKEDEAYAKKEERNRKRRTGRTYRSRTLSPEEERKDDEAYRARQTGKTAADRVNLQPFIEGQTDRTKVKE